MVTDILNPKELAMLLELYGFQKASYLALYLCSFPLYRNHVTGIDYDAVERILDDVDAYQRTSLMTVVSLLEGSRAEINIWYHDDSQQYILGVVPAEHASVEGMAIFGKERAVAALLEAAGVTPGPMSQRPIQ